MKIALADVPSVLVAYLEKHVLPKAQTKSQKTAVSVAMFIAARKGTELMQNPKALETAKALGIIDASGFVDVDYSKEMMLTVLKNADNTIEWSTQIPFINVELGYTFDAEDVEAIYEIAKTVAQ